MVEIIKEYSLMMDKGELEIILLGLDALKETGFASTAMDVMVEKFESEI